MSENFRNTKQDRTRDYSTHFKPTVKSLKIRLQELSKNFGNTKACICKNGHVLCILSINDILKGLKLGIFSSKFNNLLEHNIKSEITHTKDFYFTL